MAFLDRGQAVAAIVFGIDLTSDPEQAEVEQPKRGSERPLPRHPLERQQLGHPSTGLRQSHPDVEHPIMLGPVTLLAPLRVVQVLAATSIVSADSLEVAVGQRADPDVAPGRRNDERLASDHVGRAEPSAAFVEVDETPPVTSTPPAR